MKTQAVIIGAGALGISLAFHLSKMKISCVILEREDSYARHSSGRNAGMMRQLYRNPQLTEWAMRSIDCWPSEIKNTAFKRTGSVVLGREVPDHHRELFVEKSLPTPESSQYAPAVFAPNDGLLDPHLHLGGLISLSDTKLASYRYKHQVESIEQSSCGTWITRCVNGARFKSEWVINASGAWLNDVLVQNHSPQQVEASPYARHLFVVEGWPTGFMPTNLALDQSVGYFWNEPDGWYMRLWDDNSRLVSICDRSCSTPETFIPNPEIAHQLSETLVAAFPSESPRLRLGRYWHCFRTYTDDQLPVWGEDPELSGLFWLTAFGGFGMSTSYAAAEDAACHIVGKALTQLNEFLPSRVRMKREIAVHS